MAQLSGVSGTQVSVGAPVRIKIDALEEADWEQFARRMPGENPHRPFIIAGRPDEKSAIIVGRLKHRVSVPIEKLIPVN